MAWLRLPGKLARGEIDGPGRYWTDEELATGVAKDGKLNPVPVPEKFQK
jgi:hypothetical protein